MPGSIENLVAFAGNTVKSLEKYTFNDTISISKTLTADSNDFCFEKVLTFSLNNTAVNKDVIYAKN